MGNNIMQRAAIRYDGEKLTVAPLTMKVAEWFAREISACGEAIIIAADTQKFGTEASLSVRMRHDSPWMNFVLPKFIAVAVVTNEENGYV